jgi:redox-sensitive bicupin YhaK (pirin superfamily)
MLDLIIEARAAALSPQMKVKRILPFRSRRMIGPYIFMDHAGPVGKIVGAPEDMDVLPHPHIGLSTVSYLFGGEVTHRDSLGVEQIIRPGEVNWMTAGKGIAHSERFESPAALAGGLEMIQTWVALPEKDEEADPSFNNYKPEQLPIYTDTGVWMRLIAGDAYGLKSQVLVNSPQCYLHIVLQENARFGLPQGHEERGIYIVKGALEINGVNYSEGLLLVFTKGVDPVIISKSADTTLMLLGGEPLGDRFIWWNFVSSRKERIEQAKEDWKQGRFILPPTDNEVFIPLPEDRSRPTDMPPTPEPLS